MKAWAQICFAGFAALASSGPASAQASGFPNASTPLSGNEVVPGSQSGNAVQITMQSIAAITPATANTFGPTQTFQGIVKCGTGTVQTNVGQILECSAPGPSWSSFTTLYDAHRFDIGGYPVSSEFGNNVSAMVQALVGTVAVPSTAVGPGATTGTGVAGYATSASTTMGALGVFGFGGMTANGVSAWGYNVEGTNCPTGGFCNANTGYNTGVVYGGEIDVWLEKLSGGTAPNTALRGLYITGASDTQPTASIFDGIDIDSPGVTMATHVAWFHDIRLEDGSASVALQIGALSQSGVNNVGSMPITFISRDSSGTSHTASLFTDASGDEVVQGAPGAAAEVSSNGSCALAALPSSDTAACPLAVTGSVAATTYLRPGTTVFASLSTADPSPHVGDRLVITDAFACSANTAVTAGGGTVHSCPVVYTGSWIAEVTH